MEAIDFFKIVGWKGIGRIALNRERIGDDLSQNGFCEIREPSLLWFYFS